MHKIFGRMYTMSSLFLLATPFLTMCLVLHGANGLRCYECVDCKEPSVKNKTKQCEGADPVCFKTAIKVPEGSFGVVHTRGCMQRSNQQLNCTTITGSITGAGLTRCLCNRDLCNTSSFPTSAFPLWSCLIGTLLFSSVFRMLLLSRSTT
ncbi:hypothetical protein RvY_17911 [Ramazzottius varieornatus]|uniref:UPAR/Ly6 domain-containing protein n=1 Tax=Ramazzottius varieornatus TaxID=947166 RepID=A0A1D1W3W2_RAMVA|nr:hypothetical protein RvY_17911 [Ramazzottius varieornatus]